jgi:hypothetical protein
VEGDQHFADLQIGKFKGRVVGTHEVRVCEEEISTVGSRTNLSRQISLSGRKG